MSLSDHNEKIMSLLFSLKIKIILVLFFIVKKENNINIKYF